MFGSKRLKEEINRWIENLGHKRELVEKLLLVADEIDESRPVFIAFIVSTPDGRHEKDMGGVFEEDFQRIYKWAQREEMDFYIENYALKLVPTKNILRLLQAAWFNKNKNVVSVDFLMEDCLKNLRSFPQSQPKANQQENAQ